MRLQYGNGYRELLLLVPIDAWEVGEDGFEVTPQLGELLDASIKQLIQSGYNVRDSGPLPDTMDALHRMLDRILPVPALWPAATVLARLGSLTPGIARNLAATT